MAEVIGGKDLTVIVLDRDEAMALSRLLSQSDDGTLNELHDAFFLGGDV